MTDNRESLDDDEDDDSPPQPTLTIRQANGGFIVTDQDGVETPFEEREDIPTDTDVEMTRRMLYFITDFFGLSGSDAERICIDVQSGEKYVLPKGDAETVE